MKKPLIFLTGCVNPGNMSFTTLQNPEIRYLQYVETIKFYLSNTNLNILFVENSGIDISKEFDSFKSIDRIEFLTFNGNDFNRDLGKGYGEMLIIEHAIKKSIFFNDADFIFKITGRYKILNIKSYIKQYISNTVKILLDLRESLSYSDSRCFGADKDFYINLLKYKDLVNDSKHFFFEHALCKLALQQISEGSSYSFLKNLPRYSGVSATDNIKFKDSWFYWYPRNLKHNLRFYLMKY